MSYQESLATPSFLQRKAAICRSKKRIDLLSLLRLLAHFGWCPFGIRRRLITLAYRSEYSPSQAFDVEVFGRIYAGNLNCYLDLHVYFFGAYEEQSLFFLRDMLNQPNRKQGAVFVDIGANWIQDRAGN